VQTPGTGGMFGLSMLDRPLRNFDDARACDHGRYSRFFQAMLDRGVLLPPSSYEAMFISPAHDDSAVGHVLGAAEEAFRSAAE
jgi:glutamate-1-semialdehyde 2,1-aminomutase